MNISSTKADFVGGIEDSQNEQEHIKIKSLPESLNVPENYREFRKNFEKILAKEIGIDRLNEAIK